MRITTFKYNKLSACLGTILALTLLSVTLYLPIHSPPIDDKLTVWLIISLFIIFELSLLFYVVYYFLLPALQNCTAIEIDTEKIESNKTGLIIYWKDVVEISEGFSRYDYWLVFEMIDGSKNKISTKYVTGSNSKIYQTTQDYFAYALKQEQN